MRTEFCPGCGEEFDDYSPCACIFEAPALRAGQKDVLSKSKAVKTSMRIMVDRKLVRQGKR
jgi:hypothetical protein